jgi:hypothetical protein
MELKRSSHNSGTNQQDQRKLEDARLSMGNKTGTYIKKFIKYWKEMRNKIKNSWMD